VRGERGFRLPNPYVPWSSDGKAIAVSSWGDTDVWGQYPILLYWPDARRGAESTLAVFPLSIQWSPERKHLLVTSPRRVLILDSSASVINSIDCGVTDTPWPHAHWTSDGEHALVIAKSSASQKTQIAFYVPSQSEPERCFDLDPADLVPYDSRSYETVPRESYSLVLRRSWGVGRLMDDWSSVKFNSVKNTVLLQTFRPVGKPFAHQRGTMCKAQQEWVRVHLTA